MIVVPVKVLLVEDDEDDVVLVRQYLSDIEGAAFDVEWEADTAAALERLCRSRFDVCLVDYRLGLHDGVEFVRSAIDRGCTIPIILLTGQADHAVDMAAMNAGAADFLHKAQMTPAVLERSIRYSIQQRKTEEQRIRLLREQAARAEAEAANRAKDQFLAVLSHELRTPLSAVFMSLSALEQETEGSPSLKELVSVIKRNIDLEARLIDDLLDLTRIARGKLEIRREIVDLHEQVHYALSTCCAGDIDQKRISIDVRKNAGQCHVWGDPARLQQVLWNLVKNAVKFTPENGRITVSTFSEDGRVRIDVTDTGIGIAPEALPRIFNAFEQADPSITRQFGGLGLGLAICKALVELHGGRISAHSDGPDHGATFRVELPVAAIIEPPGVAPHQTPEHVGADRHPGISILVVEDHADTANAMAKLLGRRGYRVRTATCVGDALRAADASHFDIVISDIGLPDGSGLDLMRTLQAKRPIQGIALSGFGMEEDLARSRSAGFAEHLTKPIDFKQLEAAIARVTAPDAKAARVATP